MVTIGEAYVERVEKALVETMVLHEVRTTPQTIDNLWPKIQAIGFSSNVNRDFVEKSLSRLDRDGHVVSENGRYTVTDDGREDVMRIENVLRQVAGRLQPVGGTYGTSSSSSAGSASGRTGAVGGPTGTATGTGSTGIGGPESIRRG